MEPTTSEGAKEGQDHQVASTRRRGLLCVTRAARTLLGPAWSWLLEEWEPWLKWKILDILYSLVIVIALRRFKKSSVLHWLKDA